MTFLHKHHWAATTGKPDGRCPWCGGEFPVDSLRDEHAQTCEMRPRNEGDE